MKKLSIYLYNITVKTLQNAIERTKILKDPSTINQIGMFGSIRQSLI
jgi:hypothetical protein